MFWIPRAMSVGICIYEFDVTLTVNFGKVSKKTMELSIFVARILALVYLAAGIAALSGQITFSKLMEDFEKSPALTFVTGFITLILGMILVTYHNVWAKNWTVLITIIGWASLLKGIRLIAFPQSNQWFKGWYKNNWIWGIMLLGVGIIFGYFGFFAG